MTTVNRTNRTRHALKCMVWAGTGVVWTVAGGVPAFPLDRSGESRGRRLFLRPNLRQSRRLRQSGQSDARATLDAAIDQVVALPGRPAFMIHTGDVTHAATAQQFDDATQLIAARGLKFITLRRARHCRRRDPHAYLERYGKGATGGGWYAFDHGRPFRQLGQCRRPQGERLGSLGADQLAWLADDLSASRPPCDRRLRPHSAVDDRPDWGWAPRFGRSLEAARALRLGHCAQTATSTKSCRRSRARDFPYARSTAFPQPPRDRPSAGADARAAGNCASCSRDQRRLLVRAAPLAITDSALA